MKVYNLSFFMGKPIHNGEKIISVGTLHWQSTQDALQYNPEQRCKGVTVLFAD